MTAAGRAISTEESGLVVLAGERALCDPRGVLFFPDLDLLAVSDLHLEKGSSLARRGSLIPNERSNSPPWLSDSDSSPARMGDQRASARA